MYICNMDEYKYKDNLLKMEKWNNLKIKKYI